MLASIIILTIAGCTPAAEASPELAKFTTGGHLRSAGVDRALLSASVRSENGTNQQGFFLVRPASQ